MTLPESQLQLDDLFAEMMQQLGELVEFAPGHTEEQQVAREREFIWEFMARVLLLAGMRGPQDRPITPEPPAFFATEKARATTPPHIQGW